MKNINSTIREVLGTRQDLYDNDLRSRYALPKQETVKAPKKMDINEAFARVKKEQDLKEFGPFGMPDDAGIEGGSIVSDNQIDALQTCLANEFTLYLKSQFFHWNVVGPNFMDYHKFLGELYGFCYENVDAIAEQIRANDGNPFGSFLKYEELGNIDCVETMPSYGEMWNTLKEDNQVVMDDLTYAFDIATQNGNDGLVDFLGGLIDAHNKYQWFLKSLSK